MIAGDLRKCKGHFLQYSTCTWNYAEQTRNQMSVMSKYAQT